MSVLNFTEKRIRDLPLGSGIYRDEQVKGLLVVCHQTTRTYAVQGDVRRNGKHFKTVRVKIDRVDRLGLNEARRKAKGLMSVIQSGIDPTARPTHSGITLLEAFHIHMNEKPFRDATIRSYTEHMDRYLFKFKNKAVADITRKDVREHMDYLFKKHGKTCGAGALRTMRAIINTARRVDETIGENPVNALKIPVPPRRQVSEMDFAEFWQKTDELTPIIRDLLRTFLLTGARRLSILSVKREDIDLEKKIMRFSHMKTGGDLLFPMGDKLTEIISKRMEEDFLLGSPWLWPSITSKTGHIVETKRKGIPSAHALRHHARTMMIAANVPYAESALLLGHKLPGASGGYVHQAHLVEHLRKFSQAYEDLVMKAVSEN